MLPGMVEEECFVLVVVCPVAGQFSTFYLYYYNSQGLVCTEYTDLLPDFNDPSYRNDM